MSASDADATAALAARHVFGESLPIAQKFADLLYVAGVERGLMGPREQGKLWERHLLNSAVLAEMIPSGARVVDVGSGAGLPGVPVRIARPDLEMVLVEPMARRVQWLDEANDELELGMTVIRGRVEDSTVRAQVGDIDVVTARAVAPLARLMGWCLPLVRPGGTVLAIKGVNAHSEVVRDTATVRSAGGSIPRIVECGGTVVDPPTTVIEVERLMSNQRNRKRTRRGRQRERRVR